MFKKLFGQGGHGGGGGGGGGGGSSHQPRQMTANSTQKTVDAIQKLGEVRIWVTSGSAKNGLFARLWVS